jgi:hypothetical protein
MYLIGAAAALRNTRGVAGRVLVVLGLAFVLFAFYGSGLEANAWGLLLIAIALVVRAATASRRRRGDDLQARRGKTSRPGLGGNLN